MGFGQRMEKFDFCPCRHHTTISWPPLWFMGEGWDGKRAVVLMSVPWRGDF